MAAFRRKSLALLLPDRDERPAGAPSLAGDGEHADGAIPVAQSSDLSRVPAMAGFPDDGGPAHRGQAIATFPTQLLVQFRHGTDHGAQAGALDPLGGSVVQTIRAADSAAGDLQLVQFPTPQAAQAAAGALAHDPAVSFAETNAGATVLGVNDTYAANGNLWGMYGDASTPANNYGSQAAEAWAAGKTGSTTVVVGVVDTGIDYTHPDLYLNVWLNQGEIPLSLRSVLIDTDGDRMITFRDLNQSANAAYVRDLNANGRIDAGDLLRDASWENGVDEDGDKYTDDLIGWDFANNDNDPYDDNNHGTHVSGTIGALGNNGIGVAGVNWAVQIMPLKFLTASGSGAVSNAILALDYYTAASTRSPGHFVATNNSWGGGGYSQAVQDAIARGAKQDILFIAAAGNGGSDGVGDNNDAIANYPSNYTTLAAAGYEAVVGVAALTSTGAMASYSNYGATTVDIAAPGSGIWSTVAGGGYAAFSGTSMATPHVTGAVALMASLAPAMTAGQLRSALLTSAAPTASVAGLTTTGGRLDITAMLAKAPAVDVTAPTASLNPADGTVGVATNSNLVLTFSETVKLGAGAIAIVRADGTVFETYDAATNKTNLALAGNVLTINPTGELAALTGYRIAVAATAITDISGNGFVVDPAYDFTTGIGAATLTLTGTTGADNLLGDSARDVIDGKGATDTLNGRDGGDLYMVSVAGEHAAAEFADSGTTGIDEVRFAATVASTLKLFAGDRGIERVTIGTGTGVEAVATATISLNVDASLLGNGVAMLGSAGANVLTGTAYDDDLFGQAGNDTLLGGSGSDELHGGLGNDKLTGGAGADLFVFDAPTDARTNVDTIADFVSGTDKLQFSQAVFNGSGLAAGALATNQFWSSSTATTAHDVDDRFIYNTKTGALYYDADGLGGAAAVQVALLGSSSSRPTLLFSDFQMIA